MAKAKQLQVSLIKSFGSSKADQQSTAKRLGLTKVGQTVTLADTPDVRGMLNKIRHLVQLD